MWGGGQENLSPGNENKLSEIWPVSGGPSQHLNCGPSKCGGQDGGQAGTPRFVYNGNDVTNKGGMSVQNVQLTAHKQMSARPMSELSGIQTNALNYGYIYGKK